MTDKDYARMMSAVNLCRSAGYEGYALSEKVDEVCEREKEWHEKFFTVSAKSFKEMGYKESYEHVCYNCKEKLLRYDGLYDKELNVYICFDCLYRITKECDEQLGIIGDKE